MPSFFSLRFHIPPAPLIKVRGCLRSAGSYSQNLIGTPRDSLVLHVSCRLNISCILIEINGNTSPESLQKILQEHGWLQDGEEVQNTAKPGEGNMNVVLRTTTNQRSFILKQSRPYVQKYPDIPAPLERIRTEYLFYHSISDPLAKAHFPRLIEYSPTEFLIQMEDLGDCRDMTYWYHEREIRQEPLSELIDILSAIHGQDAPGNYPANMELRLLNHQHIFVLPFAEENGFPLDEVQPGLAKLSLQYKKNKELKEIITSVGSQYLGNGDTLLHGDYYPGSWMNRKNKVYVIDPEFSFMGFPEFDLGVMAAHAIMATSDKKYLRAILREYQGTADEGLVSQVAGTEIMRRLIGLAQLPLTRSLEEKDYLLKSAAQMILL